MGQFWTPIWPKGGSLLHADSQSGHQTNKAFERYCRVQDHTALEMAKFRSETVNCGGEVVDFKKSKGAG